MAFMMGMYCPFESAEVDTTRILALGGKSGESMVSRLMYVNPSDKAPASCVPLGMNLLDCCWERRCWRFLVTLVLMMLKARYMEFVGGSTGVGAWTTDSAAEVG